MYLVRFRGLLFVLLLCCSTLPAQEGQAGSEGLRRFDRPAWEKAIEGLDYGAPDPSARPREQSPGRRGPQPREDGERARQPFGAGWAGPVVLKIMKVLIVIVAAVVLVVLLRGLLGMRWVPRNRKVRPGDDPEVDIEKIEENIEAFDLEAYVGQAVAAGKYNLAVRLYYLAALKELSLRGLIRWRMGKTNHDYLRELGDHPLHASFREITDIFERVWYGEQALAARSYDRLQPHFADFVQKARRMPQPAPETTPANPTPA